MPLILPGNVASATASTGYDVANSVRFNDNDSPSMYKTPGSSGNRRTWTFSTWFKRGNIGASQWILDAYGGSSDEFHIYISSGNAIGIYTIGGGFGSNLSISTNNLVRDCGAWYNLIVRCDTTQGTASNRLRIYLNGTECSYGTYNNFTENGEGQVSESGTKHWIGRRNAGDYFDGYFAETVLVDGSSLAPTSFGEYDEDSPQIWKPIDVSGLTFGTNGFYLDYEDSSNLGNDANGGTDFTEANLATTDQSSDSPTNNFATLNPLGHIQLGTLSEGNLKLVASSSYKIATSTIAVSNGKWWVEHKITGSSPDAMIGVIDVKDYQDDTAINYAGDNTNSVGYYKDGRKFIGNSASSYGATYTTNDIIGIALDLDSGTKTITFYKNGSSQGSIDLPTAGSEEWYFLPSPYNATIEMNFGSPPYSESGGNSDGNGYGNFAASVPANHYCLNSKNLAEFG